MSRESPFVLPVHAEFEAASSKGTEHRKTAMGSNRKNTYEDNDMIMVLFLMGMLWMSVTTFLLGMAIYKLLITAITNHYHNHNHNHTAITNLITAFSQLDYALFK